MKIAIIGAGPSGLASAKAALERGLIPEVFEKADTLGGVWRPDGLAWPKMRVNISRHTGVFSDFPWEEGKQDFPTTSDMQDYLQSYARHFKLESHIKYGRQVTHVCQKESGWMVRYVENQNEYEEYYDAVIVASGRYGSPQYPKIDGIVNYTGEKLHSSEYRGQEFKGKTVLVVGGSVSGTAIAETAADTADEVIHVVRRPRWILPRLVPTGPFNKGPVLPHDLIKTRARQATLTIHQFYDYYTRLCEGQNKIPAWRMQSTDKFGIVIADTYLKKVDEKKIIPVKDEIVHFDDTNVVFKNGGKQKIDSVIFCTGYNTDLTYFDKELLEKLHLEMPHYSLFKHTIHPDFPTLAFVAITYRDLGAVFPTAEMQAVLACEHFLGRLHLSPPSILKKEISTDKPIGDGLQLLDALAEKLNMMPDIMKIKYSEPKLYEQVWHGAAIPAQYRLNQDEEAVKQARVIIEKTEAYRQNLLTSTNESNLENNPQKDDVLRCNGLSL